MDQRFPDEFVTWRHKTFPGIKVDEVFGMDDKTGKVWLELARQIFSEQSDSYYRIIQHFDNGAPFLEGYPGRISLTHTSHFFAVAMLPKTPEIPLDTFNPRTAMGIDAEPVNRQQVLKVRNKFLSEEELLMVPEDDLKANIIAWTSKEALYKAAFSPIIDYRNSLMIKSLPRLLTDPIKADEQSIGEANIIINENGEQHTYPMMLFSYFSYDCCVTLAYSPKCARFGK